MGGGGGGGGILGAVGGVVGGLIGQDAASGYASQASNEAGISNQIMQEVAAAPDIQKPLILQQYRQAGILTPAMEQQINLGVSQASQVKANPALQAAQQQALQQMATRSQTGLTASDRSAFNQLQQQVGSQTQGRMQSILQQMKATTGGQGSQGATLAAELQAQQQGANTASMDADQLAAQASNNALQATAQYGSMAGQQNQQQFAQQMQASQAADAFRQFDVQNQVAQQQRNTSTQNQAQQYNLNLGQNLSNANVSQANQEQYNQLQRQAQQWQMNYQRATGQSQAAAGYGNTLSGMAQQKAQAGANLGAGIGGIAGSAFDPGSSQGGVYTGGEIKGYADGGNVLSQLSPIQLAGLQAAQMAPIQQFTMPQRGAMAPINFNPTSAGQGNSKPKSNSKGSGDPMEGAENDVSDASGIPGGDQWAGADMGASGGADAGLLGGGAASGGGEGLGALMALASRGGEIVGYDEGGQVSDGIDASAAGPASGIQLAGNQQIQQAASADSGSAAPPPRQNTGFGNVNMMAGTNAAKSGGSGGGGSSIMSMLPMLAMLANEGGQIPGDDYRGGGKVPGKAVVKGDNPKNDIVPARLSPGEVVLPRSIAEKLKNAPDKDFNKHLNDIVGPFIRKSQAMADGGEIQADDSGGSAWDRLKKTLKDQFNTPAPTPPPRTKEDDYEDIRRKSRLSVTDPSNPDAYSKGGKVKSSPNALEMLKKINKYADGGEVDKDDKSKDDDLSIGDEISMFNHGKDVTNDYDRGQMKAMKQLHKETPQIPMYADGGESQPAEPETDSKPDSDDDDADTAFVRANPNSDKEIEKLAQNEFQEDQDEPTDRSKEPVAFEDVERNPNAVNPDEEAERQRRFNEEFKANEMRQAQESEAKKSTLTNDDIQALDQPSPTETDDEEQPVKAPEDKLSILQQQLRRAQAQRRSMLAGAEGAKYGSLIAAGIAGHGAQPVNPAYFDNSKLAALPVQEIAERNAMEKEDPNSAVSKFYRQRLEQSLNMKIDPDVSASGMEKMFPQVTKIVGAEYALNSKKQMADIQQANKLVLQTQKQKWQENQNQLNRDSQLAGRKMMADAMGGRVEPTVVNSALTQVENDPVIKPLRIGQQALSLSKNMLENPDIPVNPQLLNDASNGFTQALALRPGAVTQKRYDQTKINTIKNQVAAFAARWADKPDIDMRVVDPNLYNTLHQYLNTLHDDYGNRLSSERSRLLKEKVDAFSAMGRTNISNALTAGGGGGNPANAAPQKTVVKKGYNAKTNQTQFIYSDGSKETKPGKL